MSASVAVIFSVLLILTGVAKLRRPGDTARALRMLGIPWAKQTTLALATTEVVVGIFAVLTGDPIVFLAQAAMYALFLGWIGVARYRKLPISSCGCLGRPDTPPYWGHVILDGVAVAASLSAAVAQPIMADGPEFVASIVVVGLGVWLGWEILSTGARSAGLVKR